MLFYSTRMWPVYGLFLLVSVCTSIDDYSSLGDVDPTYVDNSFIVQCPSGNDGLMDAMIIIYRGDALSIYMAQKPECRGEEIENAYFKLVLHTHSMARCTPVRTPGIDTAEIVVESRHVRLVNDSVHVISCNYNKGNWGNSSVATVETGSVKKTPSIYNIGGNSTSSITLTVLNTKGTAITETLLGSYIQLSATMSSTSAEDVGMKMWNCRAFNDEGGEYYILIAGCGDGDVVKDNRGFFSKTINMGFSVNTAKSVYFRGFKLRQAKLITFECAYIVCDSDQCSGRSCSKAVTSVGRKRRAISNTDQYDGESEIGMIPSPKDQSSATFNTGLPVVHSKPIRFYSEDELLEISHPEIHTAADTVDLDSVVYEPVLISSDPRLDRMVVAFSSALAILAVIVFVLGLVIMGVHKTLQNMLFHGGFRVQRECKHDLLDGSSCTSIEKPLYK